MSHLTPDQVQDLIDHMSDEDIDFLSDLLLNTVIDAVECVEFDSAQLKQTIVRYLNQVRYDLLKLKLKLKLKPMLKLLPQTQKRMPPTQLPLQRSHSKCNYSWTYSPQLALVAALVRVRS